MKKVFSTHAQLAHVWANQLQDEGRAANMFFYGPVIYSYGHHYEIARFIEAPNGEKVCFINSNGYSNSTAKHTNHVSRAIPQNVQRFHVPFVREGGFYYRNNESISVEKLGGVIAAMLVECKNSIHDQLKARSQYHYFSNAARTYSDIEKICVLFDIELPNKPENWAEAEAKAKHLEATTEQRQRIAEQKRAEKNAELLAKWLNYEYHGQIYEVPVHLRISKDGTMIETTQGAKVENAAALRLLAKLRKGEDVKGETINGFTVIENNLDHVKIGCHTISWPVIDQFFK